MEDIKKVEKEVTPKPAETKEDIKLRGEQRNVARLAETASEWPDIDDLKLEEYWMRTPLHLSAKDPDFGYRWLNADYKNISRKTAPDIRYGYWKICSREHLDMLERKYKVTFVRDTDGLHRFGDLILAYIPKKYYDAKVKEKAKAAREQMEGLKTKLKGGSTDSRLTSVDPKARIQTEKELGMEGKDFRR